MEPKPDAGGIVVADLLDLVRKADSGPILWKHQSEDLNLNLVSITPDTGVGEHVNAEVDVLLVALEGEGVVAVEGEVYPVAAGSMILVPKGLRRSIGCSTDRFTYLAAHRRRRGLGPAVAGREASARP